MGYFDIIKDKPSQKKYTGVGKKAVKTQVKKRVQLRKAAGGGGKKAVRPTKRVKKTLWQKLRGK